MCADWPVGLHGSYTTCHPPRTAGLGPFVIHARRAVGAVQFGIGCASTYETAASSFFPIRNARSFHSRPGALDPCERCPSAGLAADTHSVCNQRARGHVPALSSCIGSKLPVKSPLSIVTRGHQLLQFDGQHSSWSSPSRERPLVQWFLSTVRSEIVDQGRMEGTCSGGHM